MLIMVCNSEAKALTMSKVDKTKVVTVGKQD